VGLERREGGSRLAWKGRCRGFSPASGEEGPMKGMGERRAEGRTRGHPDGKESLDRCAPGVRCARGRLCHVTRGDVFWGGGGICWERLSAGNWRGKRPTRLQSISFFDREINMRGTKKPLNRNYFQYTWATLDKTVQKIVFSPFTTQGRPGVPLVFPYKPCQKVKVSELRV